MSTETDQEMDLDRARRRPYDPGAGRSISMRFTGYSFGSVRVDGVTCDHDLIIDRGKVRKRQKAPSRKVRGAYGHTPLSAEEEIPLAMPPTGDRHRRRRRPAGAAGPRRGPPPQERPDHPAHGTGDRHADPDHQGHQRDPAPDMLNLPPGGRAQQLAQVRAMINALPVPPAASRSGPAKDRPGPANYAALPCA